MRYAIRCNKIIYSIAFCFTLYYICGMGNKTKLTKSLRLSEGLVDEINKRAFVENRTFTNMVEVILRESFSAKRLDKAFKEKN